MTKTRASFLALALAALGAAAVYQFTGKTASSSKKPSGPGPVPVNLAKAEARDTPLLLSVTGRTEASASVMLKARVDGQVQTVVFSEGQRVKAGEILLKLDPADYAARLAQAEANVAKSQAQQAKARADVERHLALKAKGFVSDEKVGDMRTALAAAEAVANADSAAAALARLQASYTTIHAPFAGTVGARLVHPGTSVKMNDTALAVINQVQPLTVSFSVPEKYLPRLRSSMSASKSLRAGISLPGITATEKEAGALEAEVHFLDNAVDPATGTVQLKAKLANTEGALGAGQLVSVSLTLDTLKDAVTIPAEAVQQGPDGAYVYVAKEGAAELRKLTIAATQKGRAIVQDGLAAGESVVTEGQLRLVPGAKLKPAGEAKSPALASAPAPAPAPAPAKP
jgi:multidrug efflux system membrane fusion protein